MASDTDSKLWSGAFACLWSVVGCRARVLGIISALEVHEQRSRQLVGSFLADPMCQLPTLVYSSAHTRPGEAGQNCRGVP